MTKATSKKTIVICCSAAFYEHANQIAEQLTKFGYNAIVPLTAKKMKQAGDYDVSRIKVWFKDPEQFSHKRFLAASHFEEIAKGDAILVVNDDKPGQPGYIGPNTTMEWGLAYYLKKPIFILNGVPKASNFYEEVYGLSAAVLDGDLAKIEL